MDTATLTPAHTLSSRQWLSPMWRLYICAWLAYAMAIGLASQTEGLLDGKFDLGMVLGTVMNLALPAALLALAWPLTGWLERRRFSRVQCCAIHLAAALCAAGCAHLLLTWQMRQPRPFAWHVWPFVYQLMSYGLVAGIFHTVRANAAAQRQALTAQQTRTLLVAAELGALRSKLNPHFLFNTLHSIIALTQRNPAAAETALFHFSDMLRYVLDTERAGHDRVTLDAELDFVRDYLELESLRLGERLQVEWDRREPLPWDLPLPRLTLQPLVENAVLHGISRLPEGGTVAVALWQEGATLRLRVRNPAPPPDQAGLSLHRGAGHAQRSIAHRLAWRFGPQARVTTGWDGGYYACEVTLPLPT